MRRFILGLAASVLALAPAAAALAYPWGIDPAKSSITFSGTHIGNTFEGRFESWTANIEFDPKAPGSAVVLVNIDTASARTGDATYDGTLPQADWFDVAAYPQARFEAFGATPEGGGRYSLPGKLTIRGNSVPVTLAFEAGETEARAHTEVVLDRLDFSIGADSDPTGDWVSLEIPVTITLVAHPSGK